MDLYQDLISQFLERKSDLKSSWLIFKWKKASFRRREQVIFPSEEEMIADLQTNFISLSNLEKMMKFFDGVWSRKEVEELDEKHNKCTTSLFSTSIPFTIETSNTIDKILDAYP